METVSHRHVEDETALSGESHDAATTLPLQTPFAGEPQPRGTPRLRVLVNLSARRASRSVRNKLAAQIRSAFGDSAGSVFYADGSCLLDVVRLIARDQPDVVAVFGGDGTARTALEVLTPLGIAVAPLPGGTLNRIAQAAYGDRTLVQIIEALSDGAPQWIPAGRIGARRFFCAAGFGAAMQVHAVRERLREGKLRQALSVWHEANLAMRSDDHGIDIGPFRRTTRCVIVGVGPIDAAFGLRPAQPKRFLEVASADLRGLADALAISPFALLGGWRSRPGVTASQIHTLELRSRSLQLTALLDGEAVLLPQLASIRYEPKGGLIWAV